MSEQDAYATDNLDNIPIELQNMLPSQFLEQRRRIPERFLNGSASVQELLLYLQGQDVPLLAYGDVMVLVDWVGKLADRLNLPGQ